MKGGYAMKNFMVLTETIHYIEENLCEPVSRTDIASHCSVSLSTLEKLFRYALHFSLKDYITKRRMTQAAKDIAESKMTVTEIAMKYQYNSIEVFTRAFRRVWGVNPSEFSGTWKFTGIFPKINYEYEKGDDIYMARKKVDLSEAYDYFKSLAGSYVLCFDIKGLLPINEISRKAGDAAILEAASRIDGAAGEDMLALRIGGDEFALLTGLYDENAVSVIKSKVLEKNGVPIIFEGQEIPVYLWCGTTHAPDRLKYDEFFTDMHNSISKSKK